MLPVGLTYGSAAIEALARELDLPCSAASAPTTSPPARPRQRSSHAASRAGPGAARCRDRGRPPPATAAAGLHLHDGHVRSGQQIYARGSDLTVVGNVGTGAEVIADGNIHIYGSLRGRALAGASGDPQARVFCREFHAELVAVAGSYRVLDDAPASVRGQALAIRLDGERLLFEPL